MKVIFVVILLVVSAILSRGPGVPTQGSSILNNTEVTPVADANQNAISPEAKSLNVNHPHGQPGHRCDIAVGKPLPLGATTTDTKPSKPFKVPAIEPALNATTTPSTNSTSPTQTANGLNPPHGQPGHRCDIKVGQPLNGQPAQQAATAATPVTTATTTPPTSNTTNVASGLNPKHGQPGHRCDIMVGQPLNSKPSQPAAPATNPVQTNPVQTTGSTTSPAIWSAPSATTAVPKTTTASPKLNPKHGQPGHRCDILVGQPLDSKPAQ